ERHVTAAVAVDRVVPATAKQRVVAVTAADRVIAVPTVNRQVGEGRDPVLALDRVVAGLTVDDEVLDIGGVLQTTGGRERGDGRAVVRDPDRVGRRGAVVGRRVGIGTAVDVDRPRAGSQDTVGDRVVATERVDANA